MLISGTIFAAMVLANPNYQPATTTTVRRGDSLASIADAYGATEVALVRANRNVPTMSLVEGTTLVIPARYSGASDGVWTLVRQSAKPKTHSVKAGDVDAKIARQHGISTAELRRLNPGVNWNRLQIGQTLKVSSAGAGSRPAAPSARTVSASRPGWHAVKKGDLDAKIARQYGITTAEVRRLNPGVNWNRLQIGQQIKVRSAGTGAPQRPAAAQRTASQPSSAKYTVRQGDNDWVISRRFGMTPSQLRAMNPGVQWNRLRPGQTLKVKGSSSSGSSPRPTATLANSVIRTAWVAVAKDDVNVREGGKTSARARTTVDKGVIARVLDRVDNWYKLRFNDSLTGWVRGDMLKALKASEAPSVARRSGSSTQRVADASRPQPTRSRRTSIIQDNSPRDVVAMRSGVASSLIDTAKSAMGIRYRWGGTSRSGFDCSGFVQYVYRRHGISLPRTSIQQSSAGSNVSRGSLRTGDLVFFRTGRSSRINHVGIYLGNGTFIHASSGGGRVRINALNEGYYNSRFAGARRVSGGKVVDIDPSEFENDSRGSSSSSSSSRSSSSRSGQLPSASRPPAPAAPAMSGRERQQVEQSDRDAMKKAERQLGSEVIPESTERPSRVQRGSTVSGR